MAVNIPVVIDIDKAFRDAAQRVPQASQVMQKSIDEHPLEVLVQVNNKGDVAEVLDFVGRSTRSMKELNFAIKSAAAELARLKKIGASQADIEAYTKAVIVLKDVRYQWQLNEQEAMRVGDAEIRNAEISRMWATANQTVATTIDNINAKVSAYTAILNSSEIGSTRFREAAIALGEMSLKMQEVQAQVKILGASSGSIDQMNAKIQLLNQQWAAMAANQKFTSGSRLSAEAQKLYRDYQRVTAEMKKIGMSLSDIAAKEEARRQKHQQFLNQKKKERAIMSATTKSIDVLTAKVSILQARLNKEPIGTAKFNQLNMQLRQTQMELEQARARMASFGAETKTAGVSMKGMFARMGAVFGIHIVSRFLHNIREVTAEFELQKVALGGIIQDTERASSLFRQLKAAAIESPFQIKDLVSYTKQLSAYRVETEDLFDVTMRLADVSAGLGVDMGRLILAYGQVKAASVLRGQELRQFTEAGIPLVSLLAKKFEELNGRMVSTGEVFELISKRAVPFEMISSIFEDMTEKGGVFYQMQAKQAETLAGQWSNLKDAISIMYDEMGNTPKVHRAMESLIGFAKALMNNWRTVATIIKTVGGSFLALKVATLFIPRLTYNMDMARRGSLALAQAEAMEASAGQKANLVRKLSIWQLKQYGQQLKKAAAAQTQLGRGWHNLVASVAGGGWIGIATFAVSTLVGVISSAVQEAGRLKRELAEIDEKGRTSLNRSASNFIRLATAATQAADGSHAQAEAIDELKRSYSDIIPSEQLHADSLRKLNGDYSSLTRAIEEKINMQIREQKVNAAQDYYASKITKRRKEAKEFLEEQLGLEAMQANAIFDRINEEVKKGTIMPGRRAYEANKDIFLDIIEEMTGVTVLYSNAYKDYQGNIRSLRGSTSALIDLLLGVSDVYADLNYEQQRINDEMNDATGTIGIYAKDWENLQKTLKQVTVDTEKFGNEFTFTHKKERIRQQVEILADAIKDAFEGTGIDISDAIRANNIDFNFLGEQAAKTNRWGLKGYIEKIQKSYEAVVPTNKMVGVVERKFQELTKIVGLSMDDVQGSLLRGDKDMATYAKDVATYLEEAQNKAKEYADQNADALAHPGVGIPISEEEIKKQNSIIEFFRLLLEWVAKYKKETGGGVRKDPFVEQIQNRIKFMKDFKKGYDDLNAYLSSTEALDIQSGIMFGRGQSLGLSKEEQNRAAEGLSEWYEDMIKKVQQRMRAKGAKGVTVNDLLGLSIPEANKQLRALQQLLQQLWDAKTDFDTDQKKKDLEKAIATLAEEVKRTETAKNFYNDILGLTGDTDMAATMSIAVYGDTGADLRDKIKEQLQDAFVIEPQKVEADNLNVEEVQREIDKAINTGDYGALAKYLKYVEDKYKGTAANIVNNWQKENAELAKGYDKLLLKYDEIERKRVDVTQKAAKDRETIQKGLNLELAGLQKEYEDALPQASSPMAQSELKVAYDMAVKQAQERAKAATEAIDREEKMELYKLSHDYRMFFSSINVLSEQTARAIRATVREQLVEQYLAGDITLEQYERSLRELDERYKKYENRKGFLYTYLMGGVEGAVNLKKELADDMKAVAKEINDAKSPFAVPEASQEFIDRIAELYGKKIFDGAEIRSYEDLVKQSSKDTKEMAKAILAASDNLRENAEATSQGWGWAAFWVTNVSTLIQELGQFNTELDEASPAWLDAVASLATWTLGRTDDAFDRLSALNEKATSGFQKLQQGNIVGAIADNVRGLIDFWGPNMRRINARIKEQEHLLEELSYSYDRLRDAEESAFGADYISNYEARLKALQAEQTAYQRQAELERDKGKKRDKDKIRDYEKSARDVADQIAEMQGEVAQKLLGTDLSSAARDFASSWIEAYKEFGSTTDAIKAKFNDMLQNMVIESLAARVVEQQLSPIFDEIDRLATEGGELSIVDAKVIADKAQVAVGTINTGMTNLMNALSAAGMNVRTMGSGLTGIAKDIQGASEESILGLAAGVNTQNFYLQQISGNVAAILQQMRPGGETTTPAVVEIPYVEGDVFRSRMESLDSNIATILQRLDSVITPKNTNSNTHCIAIK